MSPAERSQKIFVDPKKCSGCRICEQVCVFFHEGEFNPRRARIKILRREREGIYAPLICNQCKKCISVCPVEALSWDEKLGIVRVDADKCTGCGQCIEACDEAAIFLDPISGVVKICDLCNGDPKCVKWCGEGVFKYGAA